MPPGREFVIGVPLDREVLFGVDELDEQGELVARPCVVALSDEAVLELRDKFADCAAGVFAVCDDRLVAPHARELPAFAYVVLRGFDVFERGYFLAAPHEALENGSEL